MKFWNDRKEIYHKFKKSQGVLYYKVYPIKEDVTKEQLLALIQPVINQFQLDIKSHDLDMDEGERTFTVVFSSP